MLVTKYLYLVKYKVPLLHRNDWSIEGILLYAKDDAELQAKIALLPAQNDSTKTFLEATLMPHGFTGGMHTYYEPTIRVEEETN